MITNHFLLFEDYASMLEWYDEGLIILALLNHALTDVTPLLNEGIQKDNGYLVWMCLKRYRDECLKRLWIHVEKQEEKSLLFADVKIVCSEE